MSRVAIVGATGAVGQTFRQVLEERQFPATEYVLLASERSAGKAVDWVGGQHTVKPLTADSFADVQFAFFSAGGSVSREYAPLAARTGALVIDNSSAFRMAPEVPLVVPEINADAARQHQGIIANPNCSTIIMTMPLWPLHRHNPVRRVVVSTYQAASGAGARALEELESQTRDVLAGQPAVPSVFHVPCAFNVFSHNTAIGEDGYNVEEKKMILETHKIVGDGSIAISPTCMRVPVARAHTESLAIEFSSAIEESAAREWLGAAPGVTVVDDRAQNRFPTPLDASDRDDVLVGRIRRDPSVPENRGLSLICSGDQLRKGAALNAVQIAELFI